MNNHIELLFNFFNEYVDNCVKNKLFSNFNKKFMQLVSNKIINNIRGINRVVYDVTSKPPSTIELE